MPIAEDLGVDDVREVVTETFGIEGRSKGGEFRFLCLVHNDSHPSADCNLKTGVWSCFSCQASGDLLDLGIVALLEGGLLYADATTSAKQRKRKIQREQIQKLLIPESANATTAAIQRRTRAGRRRVERVVKKETVREIELPPLGSFEDGPLDSLYSRGFRDAHLRKWNVRYCTSARLRREDGSDFEITHSVAVPVVDDDEETPLGWCFRSTDRSEDWQPRWLFTPGMKTSETWFGKDHAVTSEPVTVVEGQADAMFLDQLGFPAVANFGTAIPAGRKLMWLTRFSAVNIFADRDSAGWLFASKLGAELLRLGTPCNIVRYPSKAKGKDPNEIGARASVAGLRRAIPYSAWRRGASRPAGRE